MPAISHNLPSLWSAASALVVSDRVSDPSAIIEKAQQLRLREKSQIQQNFEVENFEVAIAFVWLKTMLLLKRQLSNFGAAFIGEMLQRPDINEFTDVNQVVSEVDAISLARDLGMISALQTMRLLHAREIVSFFAGNLSDVEDDEEAQMTREEAVGCLRVCVQGVLGQENISVAQDFQLFREKLIKHDLDKESQELTLLRQSPYFFVKTAISVLLNLLKSYKGAQLEHVARNANLIISEFWQGLLGPERWQIGQAYAESFSEGRKEAVRCLHGALVEVNGFDYVPETLRSSTFTKVASQVISAHQGMNNFYNEPAPMRELCNLGTSIPGPALALCLTAILCVKLGNTYGVSNAAQVYADKLLKTISSDRWTYYFVNCLSQDRLILAKLGSSRPVTNWIRLFRNKDVDLDQIRAPLVKSLWRATKDGDEAKIESSANRLLRASIE